MGNGLHSCVRDTQLEKAQIESAKNILGLEDAAVSYDVVRNELGLLAMSRRRMMAELVYYIGGCVLVI